MTIRETLSAWIKAPLDFGRGAALTVGTGVELTSPDAVGQGRRFQNLRARMAGMPRERMVRTMQMLLGRAILSARGGNLVLLRSLPDLAPTRPLAVWASRKAALHDPDFRRLITAADKARDGRRWREGASAYAAALRIYDRHAGYTVQVAHCQKEDGDLVGAEIFYRDALALGAPLEDVWPHLEFVAGRNGGCVQLYPSALTRAMARQDDASARDRLMSSRELRLLAWLLLGKEDVAPTWILQALRAAPEREQGAARMIADPEFFHVNRSLIALSGRKGGL